MAPVSLLWLHLAASKARESGVARCRVRTCDVPVCVSNQGDVGRWSGGGRWKRAWRCSTAGSATSLDCAGCCLLPWTTAAGLLNAGWAQKCCTAVLDQMIKACPLVPQWSSNTACHRCNTPHMHAQARSSPLACALHMTNRAVRCCSGCRQSGARARSSAARGARSSGTFSAAAR
jgi:hypothetical protein